VVQRLHTNPRRIFSLPEQPSTYVEVDLDAEWKMNASHMHSKAQWSPLDGWKGRGVVRRVVLRGKNACIGGKVGRPRWRESL